MSTDFCDLCTVGGATWSDRLRASASRLVAQRRLRQHLSPAGPRRSLAPQPGGLLHVGGELRVRPVALLPEAAHAHLTGREVLRAEPSGCEGLTGWGTESIVRDGRHGRLNCKSGQLRIFWNCSAEGGEHSSITPQNVTKKLLEANTSYSTTNGPLSTTPDEVGKGSGGRTWR